ncbi:hypothetical protein [Chitinophaga solisilvae]|uniref:hypothetical protein n=1 Tax=Chitinophaga solisilvae TaxID=1233460 RepID=UPI00136DBF59|nr:hypothetical protein [Chitinophaga solisilvae]
MKVFIHIAVTVILLSSCLQEAKVSDIVPGSRNSWHVQLDSLLPLLGHRNWILVVDKAFPLQSAPGIVYINTTLPLPEVAAYTIKKINASSHVKPIVYTDKELAYVPGAAAYRDSLQAILQGFTPQQLLHDSVFTKLDKASSLFKVVVLKTTTTVPYSSVFINLDCKYWNAQSEKKMREVMKSE